MKTNCKENNKKDQVHTIQSKIHTVTGVHIFQGCWHITPNTHPQYPRSSHTVLSAYNITQGHVFLSSQLHYNSLHFTSKWSSFPKASVCNCSCWVWHLWPTGAYVGYQVIILNSHRTQNLTGLLVLIVVAIAIHFISLYHAILRSIFGKFNSVFAISPLWPVLSFGQPFSSAAVGNVPV
jgi:hypothetical protein